MNISRKHLIVTVLATALSFSISCQEQPTEKPQATQFDLAQALKAAGNRYEKCAEAMKPYCNPIAMAGTALAASVVRPWQLAIIAIGGTIVTFSEDITQMIEKRMALNTEKIQLDQQLNSHATDPNTAISSDSSKQ